MSRFIKYRNHGRSHGSKCLKCETDAVVREGLAYSPAQMASLTARGMPVSGLNASQAYIDGEKNPSWFVGSERERFVDVADLWEQHVTIIDKARKAAMAAKRSKK